MIKNYKPTSPGRRGMQQVGWKGVITKTEPEKSLAFGFKRAVGRNSYGRITTRHKGGGASRVF